MESLAGRPARATLPAAGADEAGDGAKKRRLAAPVVAHEGDDFACSQRNRRAAEGDL
jgi:hypothetical protein